MALSRITTALGLFVVGGLYWLIVFEVTGEKEPWDSGAYWILWYPASLAISAVAGYFLKEDGWLAGPALVLAQFPIIWINTEAGLLHLLGLFLLCVLAVPAIAVSSLAGMFAVRVRIK